MKSLNVKICGITNSEDALYTVKCGADRLGFIFAKSPRQVDKETVKKILEDLDSAGLRESIEAVGVFVNSSFDEVSEIIRYTGLDIAQVHGDEDPDEVNQWPLTWYKALRFASEDDIFEQGKWNCKTLLVDSYTPGVYGGTGKQINRELAKSAKAKINSDGKSFILAGGINPENVYSILEDLQPDGIDLGSGVEESAGKKSFSKLDMLFTEIERYKKGSD